MSTNNKIHVGEHGDRKQQNGTGVIEFNKGKRVNNMTKNLSIENTEIISKAEFNRIKRSVKAKHKKAGINIYLLGRLEFDYLGTPSLYAVTQESQRN